MGNRRGHKTLIWPKLLNSLIPMPGDAVRQRSQFHQINKVPYVRNPHTSQTPAQGWQIWQRFSWTPATYQVATGDWAGYTSSSTQDNVRHLWFKQSQVPTHSPTWWWAEWLSAVLPTQSVRHLHSHTCTQAFSPELNPTPVTSTRGKLQKHRKTQWFLQVDLWNSMSQHSGDATSLHGCKSN